MNDAVRRAAIRLREGGLVAFPTETVYGLGADASSAAAVAHLYAAKARPPTHPVIVHFDAAARAFEWAREVPQAARRLADRVGPGPLTLILARGPRAADFVTGGQDSVGLRVPSHPVAQALLAEFGGGLAAPSANRHGHVSPTRAAHVREDFGDAVMVLEGGESTVGIESTIVDLSRGAARLLRPGHLGRAALEQALGAPLAEGGADAPRAPGSLERHYAPRTPARLLEAAALEALLAAGSAADAGVLVFEGTAPRAPRRVALPREPGACARRLYAALRELDASGCAQLLVEAPPAGAEWDAVRDRLVRACA